MSISKGSTENKQIILIGAIAAGVVVIGFVAYYAYLISASHDCVEGSISGSSLLNSLGSSLQCASLVGEHPLAEGIIVGILESKRAEEQAERDQKEREELRREEQERAQKQAILDREREREETRNEIRLNNLQSQYTSALSNYLERKIQWDLVNGPYLQTREKLEKLDTDVREYGKDWQKALSVSKTVYVNMFEVFGPSRSSETYPHLFSYAELGWILSDPAAAGKVKPGGPAYSHLIEVMDGVTRARLPEIKTVPDSEVNKYCLEETSDTIDCTDKYQKFRDILLTSLDTLNKFDAATDARQRESPVLLQIITDFNDNHEHKSIEHNWNLASEKYNDIVAELCDLDTTYCTNEYQNPKVESTSNIVDISQYTDAKLAELGLELEQIEPEYARLQTEWSRVDEAFQSTKTEQDNVRKDVARLEKGLAETYKSSGISEWEAGLFIGYHCKDYISHDDKKLDAFCKAVEDFRKKSIGGSSSEELNVANYEMRSKVSGLPNASTILNCDQNQGEAIWNCKKKAIEMSSHNADWLKKWNEYSAAAKNLESLEASYQELESQKDEIRPEWNRVSTEYKRISFMICNLDASRC